MEFRILKNNEKKRIRTLYEEVFNDSKYFLDYYFGNYIENTINFVCECKGEIVGMATIHPKKLMICDRMVQVGYVYAVATKKEYRGRGIMRRIMDEIFVYALEANYEYLYLIPANPSIYIGLGYKLLREKKEFVIIKEQIEDVKLEGKEIFKVREENIPDCLKFMSNFYENRVSIFYEKANFEEMMKRLSINNSGIYCIFDSICDKILGLAFIEDDEKIIINDLICCKDAENLSMKLLLDKFNTEKMFYKLNDIMFKEVHGKLEQFKNYSICINDEV